MKYDLAVIGGGPAGYSAALEAVSLGFATVLFENRELGGTCLNRGCVPTKFLMHAAELYAQIKDSEKYGISAKDVGLEFGVMAQKKQEAVSGLRSGLEGLLKRSKVEVIHGTAELFSNGGISCNGSLFEASNILIATGSVPAPPLVDGSVTSDELLELSELPHAVKLLGGGVSAVEFAHIFRALGSEVTVCIRGERILRGWDTELANGLMQGMKRKGIRIIKNCSIEQMQAEDSCITVSLTGRVPNLTGFPEGLLSVGPKGGIVTDACGRTGAAGIYAAGDVTENSIYLAHEGMEQGRRAVRCMAGLPEAPVPAVIRCIYGQPEIAQTGLTEAEAKESGIETVVSKQTMYGNARTVIAGGERGFIKLVAARKTEQLIGAQLMCERASDMVSELAMAINCGVTVQELVHTVRPHPSYCEEITEAARELLRRLK